jgi:zinc protease
MNYWKNPLLLIATLLYFHTCFSAPSDSVLPFHEKVVKGKLPNGMRYYILKNSKPENRAELRLVVQTGSNNEKDEQQGLAHFSEHMAFNGTKKYKKSEIVDYLESIGTKFGPDLNAYTSFDETVYMLQIPTDKKEFIEKGLDILCQWAAFVSFDSVEVEKERGVVLEEWRLGKGAMERMMRKVYPMLFRYSRYSERLPIGKPEILEKFPRLQILDYYRSWYRPELQSIIVVGDVDVKSVELLIKKTFSVIPASTKPIKPSVWPIQPQSTFSCMAVSDKESPYNLFQWITLYPGEKIITQQDFRKKLTEECIYTMLNKRLAEYTRKPDPPFNFAGCGIGSFISEVKTLSGFALFPNGKWKNCLEVLTTEFERARRHGFTPQEFDLAVKEILKDAENDFSERDKTESKEWTSKLVQYVLRDVPFLSAETEYRLIKKLLPQITLEEINRLCKDLFPSDGKNTTVAFMMAEKENNPVPTQEEISQIIRKISADNSIQPYVPKLVDKPFLKNKPIRQKVIRTDTLPYGFKQWTLGNGAKVWFKPTNFKNDQILLYAYSHGGTSLYPDKDLPDINFADQVQSAMGFGNYDPDMMEKFLSDKICDVNFYFDDFGDIIRGNSSVKDLETMLQWVYAGFMQPRSDSTLFNSWKNSTRTFYENKKMPEIIFSDSVEWYLYGRSERHKPFSAKDVDNVSMEKCIKIFKERFYDPADFTFVFVGSFHPDSLKPLVEKYIGGISNGSKTENPGPYEKNKTKESFEKSFFAGSEPKSIVRLEWTIRKEAGQKERFEIRALSMLLNILLRENLREDKGGVYGVGFNISAHKYPSPHIDATCYFSCKPENAKFLTGEVKKEIQRVRTEGCSEVNLKKIKETLTRELEQWEKENEFWVNFAVQTRMWGEEFPSLEQGRKRIQELKGSDFKKWAEEYIDDTSLKIFIMYPETEKGNKQ